MLSLAVESRQAAMVTFVRRLRLFSCLGLLLVLMACSEESPPHSSNASAALPIPQASTTTSPEAALPLAPLPPELALPDLSPEQALLCRLALAYQQALNAGDALTLRRLLHPQAQIAVQFAGMVAQIPHAIFFSVLEQQTNHWRSIGRRGDIRRFQTVQAETPYGLVDCLVAYTGNGLPEDNGLFRMTLRAFHQGGMWWIQDVAMAKSTES